MITIIVEDWLITISEERDLISYKAGHNAPQEAILLNAGSDLTFAKERVTKEITLLLGMLQGMKES